jgi:hypothetical protein
LFKQYEETSETGPEDKDEKKKHGWLLEPYITRIQDKELLEMSDDGWCMSMHQPWATLLVNGVKRSVLVLPKTTIYNSTHGVTDSRVWTCL